MALVLNASWEDGGLQLTSDIGCFVTGAVASALVLRLRRDLRRAQLPAIVLLHVAVAFFGMSQASLSWPLAFPRLIPVLYVQLTVLVALTMSARAARRQVAAATALSALQFALLATGPWPWPQLELVAGTGCVMLVLIAAAGSIRLLLGRLEMALAEAQCQGAADALTGVANRHGMEQRIGGLVAQARRSGARVAVLVADLDHFKRVNDTHSHTVGDRALQTAAEALHSTVPDGIVARFGGEEFVVAALVEDEAGASAIAERMRRQANAANTQLGLTTSIGGVHRAAPEEEVDLVPWLHLAIEDADDLLYLAKRNGRDRCVVAEAPPASPLLAQPARLASAESAATTPTRL